MRSIYSTGNHTVDEVGKIHMTGNIIPSTWYRKGEVERVARGLYIHPDYFADDYFITSYRLPKGVYSHESALFLHHLSDENPSKLVLTIPSGWNISLLQERERYTFYYLKEELWELGQVQVQTPYGNTVTAYSKERTLAEILAKDEQTDRNLILQALEMGLKGKELDSLQLMKYARVFDVQDVMRAYLEVLL